MGAHQFGVLTRVRGPGQLFADLLANARRTVAAGADQPSWRDQLWRKDRYNCSVTAEGATPRVTERTCRSRR